MFWLEITWWQRDSFSKQCVNAVLDTVCGSWCRTFIENMSLKRTCPLISVTISIVTGDPALSWWDDWRNVTALRISPPEAVIIALRAPLARRTVSISDHLRKRNGVRPNAFFDVIQGAAGDEMIWYKMIRYNMIRSSPAICSSLDTIESIGNILKRNFAHRLAKGSMTLVT